MTGSLLLVEDTTAVPFSGTGVLIFVAADSYQLCTGSLISPNVVLMVRLLQDCKCHSHFQEDGGLTNQTCVARPMC